MFLEHSFIWEQPFCSQICSWVSQHLFLILTCFHGREQLFHLELRVGKVYSISKQLCLCFSFLLGFYYVINHRNLELWGGQVRQSVGSEYRKAARICALFCVYVMQMSSHKPLYESNLTLRREHWIEVRPEF